MKRRFGNVALLMVLALPLMGTMYWSSARADTVTTLSSSGEVIVGQDAATSQLPQLTIGLGNTRVTVVNPGPSAVRFSSPALGLNREIPANSQRTLWIDGTTVSGLTPGQMVSYYIVDMQGNQIASSSFTVNQSTMLALSPAPSAITATETETTMTRSQTVTTPPEEKATRRTWVRRSTVRGYW